MLTWQELWSYARTLLRWWPLLMITALLSAGTAAMLARSQPDYYRAHASLMVGNNFEVAAPDRFAVEVSNSLARYYEVLARRETILRPTAEQLGLGFPWELINRMLHTEINPQANLLEVVVTDSDPARAAAIANTIGEQLIAHSPNAPEKVEAQRAEVERQIGEAQAAIAETDRRLEELRARQSQLNAAVDLRENQEQIDELEKARGRYEAAYAGLLQLQSNADINTLSFFERAAPPDAPLPDKTLLIIAGAGLGGLLIAAVAALFLDTLDDRWRPDADLRRRHGIRNLGGVRYGAPGVRQSVAHERAIRETHTQLVLAANGRPPRMLLVSSPEPSATRSEYAIDLAGQFGRAGHSVLLVDAELAQPHVSRLLAEQAADAAPSGGAAIERWHGRNGSHNVPAELWSLLRTTHLANVRLLPGRAAEAALPLVVPLLHWPELVGQLRHVADVVIFDGPSALSSADAALLAPLVDGVVLVLNPGETSRSQVAESQARLLHNPEARLLGAVTAVAERPARRAGSARQGRFALSVDREGITITLPGRRSAPQLTDGGHATAVSARVQPQPPLSERDPMLDVLLNGGAPATIITPPPAEDEPEPERLIITPRVLVTPATTEATDAAAGEPRAVRRTVARSRAGRQRARAATPSPAPRQERAVNEE